METPPDTDTLIQFALGTLEPAEAAKVALAVAQSQALTLELAKWQESLAVLAQSVEQTSPSSMVETRILEQIRGSKKPIAAPRRGSRVPQRQTGLFRGLLTRAFPVVAVALAVFFAWRSSQLENQIVSLQQQAKTRVTVLSESTLVKLASSQNIPIGQAFLTPNGKLIIALKLPEPEAGKTYQAWFIQNGQSNPQPLETLQTSLDTHVPKNAAVIAISLEPIGGSTTPSQVLGVGEVKF
jgi:anti-sigma-K factor RskA